MTPPRPAMPSLIRRTVLSVLLLLIAPAAFASEEDIMDLARDHYRRGEYYQTLTELMRYRFLFPQGKYHAESLLLSGKAGFLGGNFNLASRMLDDCREGFRNSPEAEESLCLLGHMRILEGSPFFAYRTLQEYRYLYPRGRFREQCSADECYALAIMNELDDALGAIGRYDKEYPEGKYGKDLDTLERLIAAEKERPKKSVWVSFLGSVFLPGFGHFYTGDSATGALTLATNAGLIYLIYDAVRDDDKFRMIFFSFIELSFYQYSLISSIQNVREYNYPAKFREEVRMEIRKRF